MISAYGQNFHAGETFGRTPLSIATYHFTINEVINSVDAYLTFLGFIISYENSLSGFYLNFYYLKILKKLS
jgi:hypothetical protein